MVVSKVAYEEYRRQMLEENKKRMEELNLNRLSQALRTTTKPKQVKPRVPKPKQPVDLSEARRSSRVAGKPAPNYKDFYIETLETGHGYRRSYKRRDLLNRVYASDDARSYAIDKAEQVQSGLKSGFPSFVKPMLQSHVTGGFWLGLPFSFCKEHFPNHDIWITLVDEDGNEKETKYLARKAGLSAGWRGFAVGHELVDGDALVFQLVKSSRIKVYIIRVNELSDDDEEDGGDEAAHVGAKRLKTGKK